MARASAQGTLFEAACASPPVMTRVTGKLVAIREVDCKTVLVKSGITDYALNCYTGCVHACAYCYARFMQRFHPHPEPWGHFVDVKANAVRVLARQLKRCRQGTVFVSSACDGWQPIEAERRLTRDCCALLLQAGFRVHILTKNQLVLRDLAMLSRGEVRVGVTLTTLNEADAAVWEPGASSVSERLTVLREAKAAGLETGVMFGPVLPYLSDDQESLDGLFATAAKLKVDRIWLDSMNLRSGVWPAVQRVLYAHYPHLVEQYRAILHNRDPSRAYRVQLARRAAIAARRAGVHDRFSCCV